MKAPTVWALALVLLVTGAPLQAEPAAETPDPATPLLTAAKDGNVKAIKQVLSSGVKVDAKGESGDTDWGAKARARLAEMDGR